MKGEQGQVIVQVEGERGSSGEVVSKEISVQIIVACGHDMTDSMKSYCTATSVISKHQKLF